MDTVYCQLIYNVYQTKTAPDISSTQNSRLRIPHRALQSHLNDLPRTFTYHRIYSSPIPRLKLDPTRYIRTGHLSHHHDNIPTVYLTPLPLPLPSSCPPSRSPTAPIPTTIKILKQATDATYSREQVSNIEVAQLETTLSHCPNTIPLSSPARATTSAGKKRKA